MNDYISRQDTIESIKNDGLEMVYYGKKEAIECLESVPVADVRPVVHGEWVWREEWDNHPETHSCELNSCGWYCSKCGIELGEYLTNTTGEHVYLDDDYENPKLKYCPHCGADMRGK